MNNTRQLFLKLLLFIYLSTSFLGAMHIHHDGEEHFDDCQICVIVATLFDVDVPTDFVEIVCSSCVYIFESFDFDVLSVIRLKGFCSHAPPIFSF